VEQVNELYVTHSVQQVASERQHSRELSDHDDSIPIEMTCLSSENRCLPAHRKVILIIA
jgi:hypothetical protein